MALMHFISFTLPFMLLIITLCVLNACTSSHVQCKTSITYCNNYYGFNNFTSNNSFHARLRVTWLFSK
ncbi:hypothetical protein CW304_27900 [Bacillus sp. UFRGS-B20]|nr:hypothetical protein CW304_27900 [Bacillus sp. UFRGS-B20]